MKAGCGSSKLPRSSIAPLQCRCHQPPRCALRSPPPTVAAMVAPKAAVARPIHMCDALEDGLRLIGKATHVRTNGEIAPRSQSCSHSSSDCVWLESYCLLCRLRDRGR